MSRLPASVVTTLLAASTTAVIAVETDPCGNVATTVERTECRSKQMDAQEKRLEQYLSVSIGRASKFGLSAKQIEDEQSRWLNRTLTAELAAERALARFTWSSSSRDVAM